MLFNSPDKWWGDHGQRDYPHEGIDLCLYRDRSQKIRRIDEKTRIPVMHDGLVKAMFKDFLGKTVIIEHEILLENPIGYDCWIPWQSLIGLIRRWMPEITSVVSFEPLISQGEFQAVDSYGYRKGDYQ